MTLPTHTLTCLLTFFATSIFCIYGKKGIEKHDMYFAVAALGALGAVIILLVQSVMLDISLMK